MTNERCYSCSIFKTKFGWCGIVGKGGIPSEIIPFLPTQQKVYSHIASRYADVKNFQDCFKKVRSAIERYLRGQRTDFPFPLDLSQFSDFQRGVWKITKSIPYGELRTYRQVSEEMGNPQASRAVGTALARNPAPIVVPCHRVVRSDGKLGGYSGAGGIDTKAKLLKMEGHEFDHKGRILIFN